MTDTSKTAIEAYGPLTEVPSQFVGKMPDGMEWPSLNGSPMDFVLQLDLSSIPSPYPGPQEGLLLFFSSSDQYTQGEDTAFKIVPPTASGGLRDTPDTVRENRPLAIVDWRAVEDHPWTETLCGMDDYGLDDDLLDTVCSMRLGMVTDLEGNDYSEKDAAERGIKSAYHCYECDKLGGWPRWEQGDDTPSDRDGNPMEFLMQVGHEGVVIGEFDPRKIEWPTWGRGQIFVSPATGEFKYVWACD